MKRLIIISPAEWEMLCFVNRVQQSLNSTGHSRIGRTAVTDLYLCLSLHFTQCKLDSHAWNTGTQWLIEAPINSVSIFQILWGHLITCFYKIIFKMTNLNKKSKRWKFTLNDTPNYTTFIFCNMLSLSDVSRDMIHELSQFLIICNFWLTINLLFPTPAYKLLL